MKSSKPSGLSKGLSGKKKSSSKKKSSKKKIKHMHIEPADNGGFNVRHAYDNDGDEGGMPPQDSTHALSDPSQLLSHVQDQFGGQMPQGGAPGGGAPGGGGMPQGGGM